MVDRKQIGRVDRRLQQIYPSNATEILGGMPALIFGDFAQLPPVGDTPLFRQIIQCSHYFKPRGSYGL
jgi:ATP-dependent DNA helicase PIF1